MQIILCPLASLRTPPIIPKISQTVVRIPTVIPLFLLFWNFQRSLQFPDVIPSLDSNTELEDELDESCDDDIEVETLPEPVENLVTTRDTKLSVLQMIVFPSLSNRGFWPQCSSQSFPSDEIADVSSTSCTVTNRFRLWTKTCASSCISTFLIDSQYHSRVLDLLKVSSSSELNSFFTNHVHWYSWIDCKFSLPWPFWRDISIIFVSIGVWNVALSEFSSL